MAALPLLRDVEPIGRRRVSARRQGRTLARTAGRTATRPELAVVQRRRRWPAFLAGMAWTMVFLGLLGAAVFHTQLAERQLHIDRLERAVVAERERFDELRYERAELRSPVRLATAAGALGMQRGDATEFIDVSPQMLATQIAAAGVISDRAVQITIDSDPLDQFRAVKSVTERVP
ncbi:MAG TPA: hypothetical protein VES40_08545 [Ilumatobacteraceae bacterium]|nr:hypothetical protein [Ilumatobacteraceae bacterium]